LNGPAPAAFAANVATNGTMSPAHDSWMVTHLSGMTPGVCSLFLCRCDDVGGSIGGATERQRLAVDADLQRLQLTAILQPGRVVRQIAVDEGIRLGRGTQRGVATPTVR
jgi:hypothetical protein